MMNIREYFDSLMNVMDLDDLFELEERLLEMYYEEDGSFDEYMNSHGVDVLMRDEQSRELVLTLWVWDMDDDV